MRKKYTYGILTVNKAFKPQTTSLSLLVGDQPIPSTLCLRSSDRHTSPDSVMFGCHSFVIHLTTGG